MDNKRLLLATVLCFAVLVGWQYLAEFMGWIPKVDPATQPVAEVTAPVKPETQAQIEEAKLPSFAPVEGRSVIVDTPLYRAEFHSGGAVLKSLVLKQYRATVDPDSAHFEMVPAQAAAFSPMGLLVNGQPSWNVGQWSFTGDNLTLEAGKSASLVFEGLVNGIRLRREITFHADNYQMDEKLSLAAENSSARVGWTLATGNMSPGSTYDVMSMAWNDGSLERETDQSDLEEEGIMKSGSIRWAGTMSNYFLAAVAPTGLADDSSLTYKARILNGAWRSALELPVVTLSGNQTVVQSASWWFGPKDRDLLKAAPNDLSKSIDMGIFTIIAVPLLKLLTWLHALVGNWGIAIILLTVIIKIVFWPLTRKSYTSMEKMKKIQPMMKQLQEKHGKDKEAMSREMMQLYRTYGVNPMSGCLPILVQLPVFVALYQALLNSIALRHASFITYLPGTDMLWLADLSSRDPFYITPIVMGATMLLQQWMSPAMGDPTQRKMMMLMPVVFTVMFLNFPAGLVVYWLCNNILSIAQQWWTLHKA